MSLRSSGLRTGDDVKRFLFGMYFGVRTGISMEDANTPLQKRKIGTFLFPTGFKVLHP